MFRSHDSCKKQSDFPKKMRRMYNFAYIIKNWLAQSNQLVLSEGYYFKS